MTQTRTNSQTIADEVTSWPGIEIDSDEPGELAFKLGRREIGHLHGEHVADFSFPKQTWGELMEQHRIEPHPVFPDKRGPAARRIDTDDDVRDVITSCGSTTTASSPAEPGDALAVHRAGGRLSRLDGRGAIQQREPVPDSSFTPNLPLILARELASNLATPMFLLDDGGMLVFYNDAAELLLGKPFAESAPIDGLEFGRCCR